MGDQVDNQHLAHVWVPSTKETRFITHADQIKVQLENIQADKEDDSDYSENTPGSTALDMDEDTCEHNGEQTKPESDLIGKAESDQVVKAEWNCVVEYVNFIDLSQLNPFVDPIDCQPDGLIESEIRELLLKLKS